MQKSSNLSTPRASTRSREPAAALTGVSSVKGQATLTVKLGLQGTILSADKRPHYHFRRAPSSFDKEALPASPIKSPGSLQESKRMSPGLCHSAERLLECDDRGFPGSPVAGTQCLQCRGVQLRSGGRVRSLYTQL